MLNSDFWLKVDASGDCWLWMASVDRDGYGRFGSRDGGEYRAHRRSLVEVGIEIPDGMTVDHLCRVPACVNPDHLEVVTQGENQRRGWRASVTVCPSGHAYNKKNTYVAPSGNRQCRTCKRLRMRFARMENHKEL